MHIVSSTVNKRHISLNPLCNWQTQYLEFSHKLFRGTGDDFAGFGPHMEVAVGEAAVFDEGGKEHVSAGQQNFVKVLKQGFDTGNYVEQIHGDDGAETLGLEGQVHDVAVEEDGVVRQTAMKLGQPGFGQGQKC